MAFGSVFREERERRGLTESQVAEATRILVQIITEFENDDFHRIAAPIYGRGYVKIYANYLDLDPVPLIREFERLYEEQKAAREEMQRIADAEASARMRTGIARLGQTSVTFSSQVDDPATSLVCCRATTVAIYAGPEGKPAPLTDSLRHDFAPYLIGA